MKNDSEGEEQWTSRKRFSAGRVRIKVIWTGQEILLAGAMTSSFLLSLFGKQEQQHDKLQAILVFKMQWDVLNTTDNRLTSYFNLQFFMLKYHGSYKQLKPTCKFKIQAKSYSGNSRTCYHHHRRTFSNISLCKQNKTWAFFSLDKQEDCSLHRKKTEDNLFHPSKASLVRDRNSEYTFLIGHLWRMLQLWWANKS